MINTAQAAYNQVIPKSRGEAEKTIEEAEGYAARRRAEVNGEIQALMSKYEAYKNFPDVTRQRLYLDAMQNVLSRVETKTVIDSELQQLLPLLQSHLASIQATAAGQVPYDVFD